MARADRLERLDRQRADLEADYRAMLLAALRRCASGVWGLFGHVPTDKFAIATWAATLDELNTTGEEIDAMREKLFMEPFALHQEFLASRGTVAATAVGEPKQARAWLDRWDGDGT